MSEKRPNVVFIFADQWRASAAHYAGDSNVLTPNIDDLYSRCVSFKNAVSNCPICTPYRASLLTGQYPLTTGIFANDLCLNPDANTFAKIYKNAGYHTAYIGKWHIDGHGRSSYIPPERRQGFDYWKVLECTHEYRNSFYYSDMPELLKWEGYDAYAQTEDAVQYLTNYNSENPFLMVLSFGTPHNPYETAPQDLMDLYPPDKLILPPNIDPSVEQEARNALCGYYAHITAIDRCVEKIEQTLINCGLEIDTIFVLTSDHGDCVYSHTDEKKSNINKQRPFDESVLVPFLIHDPRWTENRHKELLTPICTPDILPTLLELCGIEIPESIEGISLACEIKGEGHINREGVLIANYMPFSDFSPKSAADSYEYRGIRTRQYTYVKDIKGERFLFDHLNDKYQMNNLVNHPEYKKVKAMLEKRLMNILAEQKDEFSEYQILIQKYGYHSLNQFNEIPYEKDELWYVEQQRLIDQYHKSL